MVVYDVCVVGAGVVGSSTAYSLAKQNKHVLLLEQFPVPHTRGSSHGQTRIVRGLYPNPTYAKMSVDAYSRWGTLEEESKQQLMVKNGCMVISLDNKEDLKEPLQNLKDLGLEHEMINGAELSKRYPVFALRKQDKCLIEKTGGTVFASKCLKALQEQFIKAGGIFYDGVKVFKIIPGDTVQVCCTGRTYQAKAVVIAAGAFTNALTSQLGLKLPLQPIRTHVCYWKLDEPMTKPIPNHKILNRNIYGLGCTEYPGMIKVCYHSGHAIDPNSTFNTQPMLNEVQEFVSKHMKGVQTEPSIVEECLYTVTPDDDFILDAHPRHKNIIIAAGFSGHGFKMAPITGEIIADLALRKAPKYDIDLFKIDRFAKPNKSKL